MKNKFIQSGFLVAVLSMFCFANSAYGDGAVIDKIYHPYADSLEKEVEYRSIFQEPQSELITPAQLHKLSLGSSFGDRWFGEVYFVGAKSRLGSFDIEAYEIEAKWQITEQGEYAADWGILFEYENETDADIQEVSVGFLVEKELGRWSTTANLFLIQEWGDKIKDEFETSIALQARYRYSALFEPALEFYAGQNSNGFGPVVLGNMNVGVRKNIHWEAGLIFGIKATDPNKTYRFLIEYEF